MQIIYADVLFILNVYITYGLLLLTAVITRSEIKRLRLLVSSFISGAYSLIIIIPDITDTAVSLSRIPASIVIVLTAFRIFNVRHFLRSFLGFFAVNFVFAGLMFSLWYFVCPQNMYYCNGIVYFDISAVTLVVLTAVCYLVMNIFHKFLSFRVPTNTVYDLWIIRDGRSYFCKSFLDTGNMLKDPFTGYPVIIVNSEVFGRAFSFDLSDAEKMKEERLRFIVCSTVTKDGLLPSFVPEKVKISSLKSSYETERVVIAVTDRKLKNGDFGAILPSSIFESGGNHAEKITSIFK